MKRGMDFFGTPKRRLRVQCHVDGISIPGVGSMRLSNLPKNLWKIGNLLLTLGQKPALFYGFIVGIVSIRGDDQCGATDKLSYSNIYMNHSQKNSFVWIQYDPAWIDLGVINGLCNFSIAEEQPVTYERIGCFCSVTAGYRGPVPLDVMSILFFGDKVTNESANCIGNFLKNGCLSGSDSVLLVIMEALLGGGAAVVFLIGACLYWFYKKTAETASDINHRPEETALLNPVNSLELKQQSPNPLLGEDPEQPPENNSSWCRFQ